MTFFITFIFFILGIIIGSFLNVVIFRFNTGHTFGGRSGCMTCENKLCWYELIPLISFFALKGRCKNCKAKISIQYPIVEFISGLMFAGIFLKFQDVFYLNTVAFSISYAYYVMMFSVLLIVAVYDYKHRIIPDMLAIIFGVLAFVGLFFFKDYVFYPHIPTVLEILWHTIILMLMPNKYFGL